jgi:hypothetical protein
MTPMTSEGTDKSTGSDDSHWGRWHAPYEDPASYLSLRLRLVQQALERALTAAPAGPIRLVSLCAGQGRDVIDVLARHPRAQDVRATLVELDPGLVAFARARALAAGVDPLVTAVEGDAGRCGGYRAMVPAQVVLVCGVFGNISREDLDHTIGALPSFCANGASVIWTRHRRSPDATKHVRHVFDVAGFDEVSFAAPPDPYVLSVGHHRYRGSMGAAPVFDPDLVLFKFVGDGELPA